MRVIQELAVKRSATAAQLCDALPDVPRTTLYRHIAVLLDSGIVCVASERKVRGSLERTLALNVDELKAYNTLGNAARNALSFLLNRYARFHAYLDGPDVDTGRDRLFFNSTVMMMDDAEFDRFLSELSALLSAYSLSPREGRRPRDISIISSPVDETGTGRI